MKRNHGRQNRNLAHIALYIFSFFDMLQNNYNLSILWGGGGGNSAHSLNVCSFGFYFRLTIASVSVGGFFYQCASNAQYIFMPTNLFCPTLLDNKTSYVSCLKVLESYFSFYF